MKRYFWVVFIVIVSMGLFIGAPLANPPDLQFSVAGFIGYDKGEWRRAPDGGHVDWFTPAQVAVRLKWAQWEIQPMIEGAYKVSYFDFGSAQAPIQLTQPREWSLHGGIVYEGKHFNSFAFIGINRIEFRPKLIEIIRGQVDFCKRELSDYVLIHGGTPKQNLWSITLGINKLFGDGKVKIGPEIAVKIYQEPPGFSQCRDFYTSQVFPYFGLRIGF